MKGSVILCGSFLAAAVFAVSGLASAQDCAVTYTRTACAGQETESYAKCDGQQTCTKDVEATTEAQCQELALKACANDRLTVTQSKVITAKFKGKALKSSTGKDDFCADYEKRSTEFNQCLK